MGVPGFFINHDPAARQPGFGGDFDTLAAPTAKVFITDIQAPVFVPGEHPAGALERHSFRDITLAFGTFGIFAEILKVGGGIKAIRNAVGTWLGYPHHLLGSIFATVLAGAAGALVPAVAVCAYPVESVEIFHQGSHGPVVLHHTHHFYIKPLIKRTMRITLHQVFGTA